MTSSPIFWLPVEELISEENSRQNIDFSLLLELHDIEADSVCSC